MRRSPASLALLATAVLTVPVIAQDVAAFDSGHADVRALMQKGQWDKADKALLALLEANKEQLYVLADRDAIVAEQQLCAFWLATPVPKVQDLVSGKIESYSPSSGHIRVRYTTSTMADWKSEDSRSRLLIHPMTFVGPYTVTVSGDRYGGADEPLEILVDMLEDSCIAAMFGAEEPQSYIPPTLVMLRGDKEEVLAGKDSTKSPAVTGKAFVAKVRVDKNSVDMTFDNKTVLHGLRHATETGQVGIRPGAFKDLVIEGDMEPSWFQNRLDQDLAEKRAKFATTYDAKKVLPAWLFAKPRCAVTRPRHPASEILTSTKNGIAFFEMSRRANWKQALASLRKLTDDDLPAVQRQYLEAHYLGLGGDFEAALPIVDSALAAIPQLTYARVLKGELLHRLHRKKESAALLQQAVADDPGNVEAIYALFTDHMTNGNVLAAERLVRDSKCTHGLFGVLDELDQMLAMRRTGPAWPRAFSNVSAHYEVHSDIDAKVCAEACRVLETSYVNLKSQIASIKEDKDQPRFQVYLFSGESSYQEYNRHILGAPVPHTAGLYSPALKQLLIWNVPKHEEMVRTIRHEGFHQFLDRLVADPPAWFNEGMAEFWETARQEADRFTGGQPRPGYVALLQHNRATLPSLHDFAYGTADDFYANAELRYAQAWALVYFLRKGPPAYGKLFGALWDAMRQEELTTRAALDKAFAKVEWSKLEKDFWDWLPKAGGPK